VSAIVAPVEVTLTTPVTAVVFPIKTPPAAATEPVAVTATSPTLLIVIESPAVSIDWETVADLPLTIAVAPVTLDTFTSVVDAAVNVAAVP